MKPDDKQLDKNLTSRRSFIQHAALAAGGLMVASPMHLLAQKVSMVQNPNIKPRGYASLM